LQDNPAAPEGAAASPEAPPLDVLGGAAASPEAPPLHPDIRLVELEGRSFYILGTAHVSQASVELVKETLEQLRPDSVAVELCHSRYQTLRDPERWKNTDVVAVIKQGKGNLLLAQLLLSSFQKRIGKQLGVKPGAEMMQAMDTSQELGIATVLADRDVGTTLRRTWSRLSWWSLAKLLSSSLVGIFESHEINEQEVERLKRSDALEEALKELSQHLPEVGETLVDERDRYLAAKIYASPGQRVVAVVGAGHVQGIAKYLGSPQDISLLEVVPPPSRLSKAMGWLIPLAILAALIYGFLHWGQSVGLRMLGTWALLTAAAGALGCMLSLAHPFTTISGFLFAPIGALHPLVATGWITGLVEAGLRKPRVADFESLSEQSLSLKLMYQNRVTRILLVAMLTNLCVGLGNLLGGALMFRAV